MAKDGRSKTKQLEKSQEVDRRSLIQREDECIRLAMELAEKQLREGTASSQVITQFLKLGSSRERIEQNNKELEGQLMEAKREAIKASEQSAKMIEEAMAAFKEYRGD